MEACFVAGCALQGLEVKVLQAADQALKLVEAEQGQRIPSTHLQGPGAQLSLLQGHEKATSSSSRLPLRLGQQLLLWVQQGASRPALGSTWQCSLVPVWQLGSGGAPTLWKPRLKALNWEATEMVSSHCVYSCTYSARLAAVTGACASAGQPAQPATTLCASCRMGIRAPHGSSQAAVKPRFGVLCSCAHAAVAAALSGACTVQR